MKRSRRREIIMPDFCSRRFPFHYFTALNNLQKIGIEPERVRILAIGEFENYRGEVRRQEPEPGTVVTGETDIVLEVGYPGIVDLMPYQFFYGLRGVTKSSSAWEDNARKFMAPFDASVVRRLSLAKYLDLKFNFSFLEEDQIRRFLDFFEFDFSLVEGIEELHQWLDLLPFFSTWGGNAKMTAWVLKMLFGYDFELLENRVSYHDIPEEYHYKLGSRQDPLGRGTILGRRFRDFDSACTVIISGFDNNEIVSLLPNGKKRKKIERILEWCMPSNLESEIKLKAQTIRPKLGEEANQARLGCATFL